MHERDFLNLTEPKQRAFRPHKAPLAIGAIVGVMLLAAFNILPIAALALLAAIPVLLTELISNNAVAVLLTPIAFEIAATMGVDARPFCIAIMFGCSASFATPIGYPTNTYVFGAGGYRFTDFPRVGAPLNFILWIAASVLIPIFWPFGVKS